ncbi:DUF4157 domain-containing protein [Streptosporangium canum]|uniref:eCIS core domain-containing protein n=1 Tax=Streptosporangium canum TaxID=324952 RepID=UPI0033AA9C7F
MAAVVESGGEALDGGTRAEMEARFGFDFSQVRVHSGESAAHSIGAAAFAATVFAAFVDLQEIDWALGAARDALTRAWEAAAADKPFFVDYVRGCKVWMLKVQGDLAGHLP